MSQAINVLQVIPSLSPRLGGPTAAMLGLSKSLRNMGVSVQILTTNDDADNRLDVPVNRLISYQGIPTTFLPRTVRAKEFIYSHQLAKWHRQYLNNFDLVHTHYLFSHLPSFTARAARQRNIPYLMRPLGQLTPWALSQSANKKKIYTQLLERRNLEQAAAIYCTSPEEASNVRTFGLRTPTVTLPLGVYAPEPIRDAREKLHQLYGIPVELPVVLFLSRLHHKKQPEVLIRAVEQLLKKQPCHIVLAGTGEPQYVEKLKKLVGALDIQGSVTFAGFVSGYSKNLLLQGSDIFALPSHSENFGIAVAEALIAGLPVVITPGIQISEEINAAKAGLVMDANVSDFSSALYQLMTMPHLRRQLVANGLSLAKTRYSWASIAQQLTPFYREMLSLKQTRASA